MPIASLPLELVFEIVSHLQEEEKIPEQIQGGKTVSLVCRSWRSLGQGLRWKTIKIFSSRFSSLNKHFVRFPHLVKYVRDFDFRGSILHDSVSGHTPDAIVFAQLPRFLSGLICLERFIISGDMQEDVVPILEAASHLKNLSTLSLFEVGAFNCSNEFVASFRSGFKKLSELGFHATSSMQSSLHVTDQLYDMQKIPIDLLLLDWRIDPAEPSRFANDFFSIMDPTTLKVVELVDHAVCTALIDCLAGCPNLVNLHLNLYSEDLGALAQILPIIPRFPSLDTIKVLLKHIDEEGGFESPVSLSEIIASFSPSLRIFSAEQFIFPDFSPIPVRQVRTLSSFDNVKGILARRPLHSIGGGSTELLLWGEEEEGKVHWFREPEEAVAAE
ncbi:hypothetical protein JCM5350_004080 [Sporobolomyces pararoseus]